MAPGFRKANLMHEMSSIHYAILSRIILCMKKYFNGTTLSRDL